MNIRSLWMITELSNAFCNNIKVSYMNQFWLMNDFVVHVHGFMDDHLEMKTPYEYQSIFILSSTKPNWFYKLECFVLWTLHIVLTIMAVYHWCFIHEWSQSGWLLVTNGGRGANVHLVILENCLLLADWSPQLYIRMQPELGGFH